MAMLCMDEHCLGKFGNAELVKVSALKTNKYHYDKSGENAVRRCISCGRFSYRYRLSSDL